MYLLLNGYKIYLNQMRICLLSGEINGWKKKEGANKIEIRLIHFQWLIVFYQILSILQ
jgi:hypothetical protein